MRKPRSLANRKGRVERPDGGNNAPRKLALVHAGKSRLARVGVLDQRTTEARYERATREALLADYDNPSPRLQMFAQQGARLRLLAAIAWAEIHRCRNFADAGPALDAFARLDREFRAVLTTLGLSPQEKELPSLDDLRAQYAVAGKGDE